MRAANNADEVLLAADNWVNEGQKHPRRDRIRDFARGTVLLRIGGNDYTAEVVVATENSGRMKLYDILRLEKTQFTEREMDAGEAENPFPGTNRRTASISEESIADGGQNVNRENAVEIREPSFEEKYALRLPALEEEDGTARNAETPINRRAAHGDVPSTDTGRGSHIKSNSSENMITDGKRIVKNENSGEPSFEEKYALRLPALEEEDGTARNAGFKSRSPD